MGGYTPKVGEDNINELDSSPSSVSGLGWGLRWTLLALVAQGVSALVIPSIVIREFGSHDYGYIAVITAILGVVSSADGGVSAAVTRAAARILSSPKEGRTESDEAMLLAGHSTNTGLAVLTLIVGAVCSVLIFLTVNQNERGSVSATAFILTLGIGVFIATAAFSGAAIGRRGFRLVSVGIFMGSVANVAIILLLAHPLGLSSVALGFLASVLISRGLVVVRSWQLGWWFKPELRLPNRNQVLSIGRFALPLLVIGLGSQILIATDLAIVISVSSVSAAGFYRLGMLIPAFAAAALFGAYDVVFPALSGARNHDDQKQAILLLNHIACYIAGVGLGFLALMRNDLVQVMAGHQSKLAAFVLGINCLIWALNLPVHGLALLAVARGVHSSLSRLVATEIFLNIVLTIILSHLMGPKGAAIGTLVSIGLADAVAFPLLFAKPLQMRLGRIIYKDGMAIVALGMLISCVALVSNRFFDNATIRLAVGIAMVTIVSLPIGIMLLGRKGRSDALLMLRKSPTNDVGEIIEMAS